MNDRAVQPSRFKGKVGNGCSHKAAATISLDRSVVLPCAVQSRESAHLISGVSNRHYMSAPMCSIPPLDFNDITSTKPSFKEADFPCESKLVQCY